MALPPRCSFFETHLAFLLIGAFSVLFSSCSYFGIAYRRHDAQSLRNVRTLAGLNREFGEPFGIAVRGSDIFVADGERSTIFRVSAGGEVSPFVQGLNTPSAIAFAPNGDLIVADTGSHTIRRVTPEGSANILAGVENRHGYADGDAATALFNGPIGVAVADDGAVIVADTYNDRIRIIENGTVRTLAGGRCGFADGAEAQFDTPLGLAIWHGDKVLVADSGNGRIRVVEPDGTTWTLAGSGDGSLSDGTLTTAGFVQPTAIAVDQAQSIFVADGNGIRAVGRRSFPFVETITSSRRGLRDGAARQSRFNRPSGLAVTEDGGLIIADSENQVIRVATDGGIGTVAALDQQKALRYTAEEFRELQPARWPLDPPDRTREIAGTLGEVRGEIKLGETAPVWFHNGLDIAGGYGEPAHFVRTETVLHPRAVENFGTARELIRMPTMGYIHIRLGRYKDERAFDDLRFQFERDETGRPTALRVPRGTRFKAGDTIGTLNALNHVHLIAGRAGSEMNALDALVLPGVSDKIPPTVEQVKLFDPMWTEIETENGGSRIKVAGITRVVVRAHDRVDGNANRRKLGVYRLGYQLLKGDNPLSDLNWTISFERMPANEAVRFAYAPGSRSGYTPDTVFDYIVTNRVNGDEFGEGFVDPSGLENGTYTLRVFAADFFGNTAAKDLSFEVSK